MNGKVYDIVVVGGGPAGIGAAFSAARLGLSVAIIERHNMLGGNWTNGYVLSILGMYTYSGNTKIVGGIADYVVERLSKLSGTKGKVGNFIPFRPDEMKLALELASSELGIDKYFGSMATGASIENGLITGIQVTDKSGLKEIKGKVFVDSSGECDVTYLAGLGCMSGRSNDGAHQDATLPFRIGGVDEKKVIEHAKRNPDELSVVLDSEGNVSRIRIMQTLVEKAKSAGDLYLPLANSEFLFNTSRRGEFVCNATHVHVNNFGDGAEMARITADARKQAVSSLEFLVKYVGGFENAYLIDSAPSIGLRETRRAIGEYILTKQDVISNARFDDAIVRCGHPVEVHDPEKGVYYVHLNGGDDSWYEIPYRAIVVKGAKNLFAIGRCLSAEFEAQASARVTGTAMGMGQAAATAASMMIEKGIAAQQVDVKELQNRLRKAGAII
ncbi:MAG: FAD-dependent oxidoreductase [Candidatus Micrarchaeia archaeon]